MRKFVCYFSLLIFLFSFINSAYPQGVSINTSGAPADNSAMLDISSNNQGVLIPRMTSEQRNSIPSPAIGLLIYNLESQKFNYFKSTGWYELICTFLSESSGTISPGGGTAINSDGITADSSAILDVSSVNRGILLPRTSTDSIVSPAQGLIIYDNTNDNYKYFNGSIWKTICEKFITATTGSGSLLLLGVAINSEGNSADSSSILDISSNTKGLLIPRMSSTDKDQIMLKQGLMVYENTSTNTIDFTDGINWFKLETDIPAAPTAGTQIASGKQIVWNWNPASFATGYKYNTLNDYATATDNGTNTEYTQTGLECNTSYTLYVWAYNNCDHSPSATLNQKTPVCGGTPCDWNSASTFTVTHTSGVNGAPGTKTITYGQVQTDISGETHCWITQNLGADNQAISPTDTSDAAAGWYWQFYRMQGHTINVKGNVSPAFYAVCNFSSWAPVDPCTLLLGAGWRLPTNIEWNNAIAAVNGLADGYTNAYNSVLKLHAAGYYCWRGCCEQGGTAVPWRRGFDGCYRSSTPAPGVCSSFALYFNDINTWDISRYDTPPRYPVANSKWDMANIRCLK